MGDCRLTFICQEPVHVAYVYEILLAFGIDADGVLPFVNQGEDLGLSRRGEERGSFGKSSDKLVEEFLCGDLKVKWIAYILDEMIQEVQCQDGDLRMPGVYFFYNCKGGFARAV